MGIVRIRSGAEQVAEHLRKEIANGRWKETIPGVHQLADELGVNHKTVKTALSILEQEELVISQGPGRRRAIQLKPTGKAVRPVRIGILAGDPKNKQDDYMLTLYHELIEAGHQAFFTARSLAEMNHDLKRVRRLVEETDVDAWLVVAGSRDVLEWFASQEIPAFALFGRRRGLPIASIGPDKATATVELTRRLIGLGHRRIVLLCRKTRRLPEPGAAERAFVQELDEHGIEAGPYHLPDWEETPLGLRRCLNSLFRVTPPTALIVDEPPFLVATLHFLTEHRVRVPQDLSLMATDPDSSFQWCHPSIAHMKWESRPWIRRVLRWANSVSLGKPDHRQTFTKAEFVEGGTIGPVNPSA